VACYEGRDTTRCNGEKSVTRKGLCSHQASPCVTRLRMPPSAQPRWCRCLGRQLAQPDREELLEAPPSPGEWMCDATLQTQPYILVTYTTRSYAEVRWGQCRGPLLWLAEVTRHLHLTPRGDSPRHPSNMIKPAKQPPLPTATTAEPPGATPWATSLPFLLLNLVTVLWGESCTRPVVATLIRVCVPTATYSSDHPSPSTPIDIMKHVNTSRSPHPCPQGLRPCIHPHPHTNTTTNPDQAHNTR
jgi:hypothetical protein